MKKILLALTAIAALGASEMCLAQSQEYLTPEAQALIAKLQADKKAVVMSTLKLDGQQLADFTPIYDDYEADMKKLLTGASNLSNQLYVADYGGMTEASAKDIMPKAFKLRKERIETLQKYAEKAEKKLPAVKVFQWVQVENKSQALLDVAAAKSIPIVTPTPYRAK